MQKDGCDVDEFLPPLKRRESFYILKKLFKKTVTVARSLGMMNLGHISTDRTKIKANASHTGEDSQEDRGD